jgi:gas vesicle structural protein
MQRQTGGHDMTGGYLERPAPSGLADVIEILLDKGIVIDAYIRVSLVGIEVITLDARVVIASVDTYLRFAEATNRLDLYEHGGKDLTEGLAQLGGEVVEKTATKVAEKKVGGLVEKAAKVPEAIEEKASGAMRKAAKILPKPGSD